MTRDSVDPGRPWSLLEAAADLGPRRPDRAQGVDAMQIRSLVHVVFPRGRLPGSVQCPLTRSSTAGQTPARAPCAASCQVRIRPLVPPERANSPGNTRRCHGSRRSTPQAGEVGPSFHCGMSEGS